MAITASISLPQSTIGYNQLATALVTVSNSGGSDVTVTELKPQILATGAPTYQTNINSKASSLPKPPGQVFTSPAGSSVVVPFSFLCYSPQVAEQGNLDQSVPATYAVGCIVQTSDGSLVSPTAATVTITPITAN